MKPTAPRRCLVSSASVAAPTLTPLRRTSPSNARRSPAAHKSSVDFPEPDGPIIATISPSPRSRLTRSKTGNNPEEVVYANDSSVMVRGAQSIFSLYLMTTDSCRGPLPHIEGAPRTREGKPSAFPTPLSAGVRRSLALGKPREPNPGKNSAISTSSAIQQRHPNSKGDGPLRNRPLVNYSDNQLRWPTN